MKHAFVFPIRVPLTEREVEIIKTKDFLSRFAIDKGRLLDSIESIAFERNNLERGGPFRGEINNSPLKVTTWIEAISSRAERTGQN